MHSRSLALLVAAGALVLLPGIGSAQQEAVITGKVQNAAGVPLSFAEVYVQELRLGALTQSDGAYRLVIPAARVTGSEVTLTARLIGYKEGTAKLALTGGPHTQDFTLEANPLRLGEVVVTGEGLETERQKLGAVINTVDTSLVVRSDETNIVSALSGKAPNVEVTSSSGDPGSSSYIRIRGPKTITGDGQPLFVVDGVPIDNSTINTEGGQLGGTTAPNRASDINPQDIASVEILKGSAAAAIYGSQGAQGVVLITTKHGQAGPTRYSLRSSYSFDDVNKAIPLQTTYGHGSRGKRPGCDLFNPAVIDPATHDSAYAANLDCGPATSSSWGPKLPAGTKIYDHFNELFHTGHTWSSTLAVSGGNDRTLYYVSGGRDNNTGIIIGPNSYYDKITVRANGSHRVFDNLKVGADLSYVDTRGRYIQQGSNIDGLLLGAMRTPPEFPNFPFLDPKTGMQRSYRFPFPSTASQFDTRGYDNPGFVIYDDVNSSQLARTFGNLNAEYDPFDWLTINERFGSDYYTDNRLEGFPYTSSGQPTGQVISADFKNYILDQNLTATARHTFSPSFSGTLTLGQNADSHHSTQIKVTGVTLAAAQPFNLLNSVTTTPTDFETLVHSASYFGQLSLDLFNQLFLTGAARYDGFSTFGTSSRYHWFPKASAAWNFYTNNSATPGALTYGKLRLAYGESGTLPAPYITNASYAAGVFFGDAGWGDALFENQAGQPGLSNSGQRAQPLLGPERTKEVETGFDLGLFNNYADASLTLYRSHTLGAIFLVPLPTSTGYFGQAQNTGNIRNQGVEAQLNVRPIMRSDLNWEIGVQWARNQNKVIGLAGQQFVDLTAGGGGGFTGAVPTAWAGSSVGVIRGNDFARCGLGLNIGGENIDQLCGNAPRGALFLDTDGYPILDPTDRVIADANPKWTGSVRSTLTFHKVTLSALVDIKHGGQVWDGTRGALYNFGKHIDTNIRGTMVQFGKQWMPGPVGGPGAGISVPLDQNWFQGLGSGFGPVASQFIEDGGYTKLREISVAYTLTQPWLINYGFSSVDLRVSGRNLHTWTKYRGIDPEASLAGATALIQGIDYFNNPQTRSIVVSIGLNR